MDICGYIKDLAEDILVEVIIVKLKFVTDAIKLVLSDNLGSE